MRNLAVTIAAALLVPLTAEGQGPRFAPPPTTPPRAAAAVLQPVERGDAAPVVSAEGMLPPLKPLRLPPVRASLADDTPPLPAWHPDRAASGEAPVSEADAARSFLAGGRLARRWQQQAPPAPQRMPDLDPNAADDRASQPLPLNPQKPLEDLGNAPGGGGLAGDFPALPPDPNQQPERLPELGAELYHHGGSYLYAPEGDRLGWPDKHSGEHFQVLRKPEDYQGPEPLTLFADFLGAEAAHVKAPEQVVGRILGRGRRLARR